MEKTFFAMSASFKASVKCTYQRPEAEAISLSSESMIMGVSDGTKEDGGDDFWSED